MASDGIMWYTDGVRRTPMRGQHHSQLNNDLLLRLGGSVAAPARAHPAMGDRNQTATRPPLAQGWTDLQVHRSTPQHFTHHSPEVVPQLRPPL